MYYREGQSNWFGKHGIPMHVTHALALVNGALSQHTLAHVFDSSTKQVSGDSLT